MCTVLYCDLAIYLGPPLWTYRWCLLPNSREGHGLVRPRSKVSIHFQRILNGSHPPYTGDRGGAISFACLSRSPYIALQHLRVRMRSTAVASTTTCKRLERGFCFVVDYVFGRSILAWPRQGGSARPPHFHRWPAVPYCRLDLQTYAQAEQHLQNASPNGCG